MALVEKCDGRPWPDLTCVRRESDVRLFDRWQTVVNPKGKRDKALRRKSDGAAERVRVSATPSWPWTGT